MMRSSAVPSSSPLILRSHSSPDLPVASSPHATAATASPSSGVGRRRALSDSVWPREAEVEARKEKAPLNHQRFLESLSSGLGGGGAQHCVQVIIETLLHREAQKESEVRSPTTDNTKLEEAFKTLNLWRNGLSVDFNRKVAALEHAFLYETASLEVRTAQREKLDEIRVQLTALCHVIDVLGEHIFTSHFGAQKETQFAKIGDGLSVQFQRTAEALHTALVEEHEVRQNHRFAGVTVSREAFPYNAVQLPKKRMERVALASLTSCQKPSLLHHAVNRFSTGLRWFNGRCVPTNPILKLVFWSLLTVFVGVALLGIAYGILYAAAPLTALALAANVASLSATALASIKIGTVLSALAPVGMALWTYIKRRLFPEPEEAPPSCKHHGKCTEHT